MAATCKTIHILGLGNIGKLTAHCLAASTSASVTLLLHRWEKGNQWEEARQRINVVTNGDSNFQGNLQYEKIYETNNGEADQIFNLIVATKTCTTTEALRPIRNRLKADSTILFLQNGMGTVDEVTNALFATPSERPHYYAGVVSHGVYSKDAFSIVHAGQGSISIGAVRPSHELDIIAERSTQAGKPNFLLQCLHEAPALSTSLETEERIIHIQLQKLAINAVINPLTAIFDCLNGELFDDPRRLALMRLLLAEISPVICAIITSSFTEKPSGEVASRFSPSALERMVLDAASKTAQNVSSMRQDMLAGRRTEIEYINGYIVAQGTKIGHDCGVNRTLVQLINDKRKVVNAEISSMFPDVNCK